MSGFHPAHRPPYGLFPPFSHPPPPSLAGPPPLPPVPPPRPVPRPSNSAMAGVSFPPAPNSIPLPRHHMVPPPLPRGPTPPQIPPLSSTSTAPTATGSSGSTGLPGAHMGSIGLSTANTVSGISSQQNFQQTAVRTVEEPVRPGLVGVKRKHLAKELMCSDATSHHVNWTAAWDSEMPDDLMAKCQPLFCELCGCTLVSPLQAKMHYQGKTHDKHVRRFFLTNGVSEANLPRKMDSSGKFPRRERCDLCNLDFTSTQCLDIHLLGKSHQKMVASTSSNPPGGMSTKSATFNKETKKWEKTTQELIEIPVKQMENSTAFFCELCKVGAPSQSQLDMHLNGKSHKKKMEKGMTGVKNDDLDAIQKRMKFKESVLNKMQNLPLRKAMNQRRGQEYSGGGKDLSSYRTPSGSYYCASCNVTINSAAGFEEHTASKKHKQKNIVHKFRR